ncbi:MAG: DUF7305 domain-containing protein, partial [Planctomycetota bacterium]
ADGLGNVVGSFAGGTYDVVAVQDAGDASRWTLTATGTHGLGVRRVTVGIRSSGGGLFPYAIYGDEYVQIKGPTDAFDSALGSYLSQQTNVDGTGPYAAHGGHVGGNAWIKLSSGTWIRGDALPGPLDTVDHPELVAGDTTPQHEEVVLPPPPIEDFIDAMNNGDNDTFTGTDFTYDPAIYELVATGGELVFDAGTYFFSTFEMSGGTQLRITGPVEMYVVGEIVWTGGVVVNETGRSRNLIIYAHPYDIIPGGTPDLEKTNIRITGGGESYLAFYAPARYFEMTGGTDIWGAVVCRGYKNSSISFFHYDSDLASYGGGGGGPAERLYWVELDPPRR